MFVVVECAFVVKLNTGWDLSVISNARSLAAWRVNRSVYVEHELNMETYILCQSKLFQLFINWLNNIPKAYQFMVNLINFFWVLPREIR